MPRMRVCVPGAQYLFWRSKKFFFPVAWARGLHFWSNSSFSWRCYWRCVLSWPEMRMSWRSCNNSKIHLCLWKVWSLLVCSQSSFTLQDHVRTTKTDETHFFFAKKMNLVPNKQLLLNVPFQSTKYRKKKMWTTKYKRLLEICIVPQVEMKSVFTFQPIKRLVLTTVKSSKPAVTFWILLLRTKNWELCYLAVTLHLFLQETRIATTEKKSHLLFWKKFFANDKQAHPNLNQKK